MKFLFGAQHCVDHCIIHEADLFLKSGLLRYSLYTVQSALFSCTVLIFVQVIVPQSLYRMFPWTHIVPMFSFVVNPFPSSPHPPTTDVISVVFVLLFPESHVNVIITMYILKLAYFSQLNAFRFIHVVAYIRSSEVHTLLCANSFSLYGYTKCVYSFSSWWTF